MAEQENISELENVVNPDPSTREDSMEGRMDLVQAVVAAIKVLLRNFLQRLWHKWLRNC